MLALLFLFVSPPCPFLPTASHTHWPHRVWVYYLVVCFFRSSTPRPRQRLIHPVPLPNQASTRVQVFRGRQRSQDRDSCSAYRWGSRPGSDSMVRTQCPSRRSHINPTAAIMMASQRWSRVPVQGAAPCVSSPIITPCVTTHSAF